MINRALMNRQMFANGGAVARSPSDQGEMDAISRDLLRLQREGTTDEVYNFMLKRENSLKQDSRFQSLLESPGYLMFKQNFFQNLREQPRGMQEGGPVAPMGMPPVGGPMVPMGGPPPVGLGPEMGAAMLPGLPEGGEAALEGLLAESQGRLEGMDGAQNYEEMINALRGDQAPLEERREELAGLVGPEDASQTPESVLTLVQPVIMMAEVDQGIGSLPMGDMMSAPVEGNMADGIMTTVNMGAEAPVEGVPAPVNFNQGGAVQYMQPGGVVNPSDSGIIGRASELAPDYLEFLNAGSAAQSEADLAEARRAAQASALFGLAGAGLQYAQTGEFAPAASTALQGLATASGGLREYQEALKERERALDLSSRQAALTQAEGERETAAALAKARAEALNRPISDVYRIVIQNVDGSTSETTYPLTQGEFQALKAQYGNNVSISKVYKPDASSNEQQNFLMPDSSVAGALPGTLRHKQLTDMGLPRTGEVPATSVLDRESYTVKKDMTIGDKKYSAGTNMYLTQIELNNIIKSFGNDVIGPYESPVTNKDYFDKYGMTEAEFNALTQQQQQFMQGLPVITDKDYFDKFNMTKNDFLALPVLTRQRLLGIEPEYEFIEVETDTGVDVLRIDKNNPEVPPVSIYSAEIAGDPDFFKITMPSVDDPGVQVSSIVDISTEEGREVIAKVNQINQETPGAAAMQRIGTESTRMSAFLVLGDTLGGGASVRMSYDGGKTYIGSDGRPRLTPSNAFALSDTIAYDVYRREKVRSDARQWLNENDNTLNDGQYFGAVEGGAPIPEITKEDKALVTDVLQQIRNGTGPWSAIGAGVNAVVGGVIAPETFSAMFKETEEGRQFAKLVYVLGRSALASNPRLAVADLEVTGTLFPNPDDFFGNPVTEANKIVSLMKTLDAEESRLQQLRASESPVDSAQLAIAEQKLGEISRLKNLLGPVLRMRDTASPLDISGAQNLMRRRLEEQLQGAK